jgi:hypothetical protein
MGVRQLFPRGQYHGKHLVLVVVLCLEEAMTNLVAYKHTYTIYVHFTVPSSQAQIALNHLRVDCRT